MLLKYVRRPGVVLVLLVTLALACAPTSAQSPGCQLREAAGQLAAQIPGGVGACQGAEENRIELGEVVQPTTTGQLVYHSIDGVVSFTDGSQTWVLDPTGQVQVRGVDERFPFEFNGDGFPLVGQPRPRINAACPTQPINVLAVENFYADLVNQIGGQCVSTSIILADPDADPHEFQPAASDVRSYQRARLVIENGLGYDDFSDKILSTMVTKPQVINAGVVLGLSVGANPHVWYSAGYVDQIRGAISSGLKRLEPQASSYFDDQSAALDQEFTTYRGLVDRITSEYGNVPVGATESIFVGMANTTGLNLISPPDFMQALSEGNDPTARDVATFENQITNRQIKVLVYNTQTVTSLTEQLKAMAQQNNIPIVGVSETMPRGAQTFQGWHATELKLLLQALQKAAAAS